uniref:Uncharacterized protein n=1 Tax=Oryza glumipatula TaxID=40148 RepID=A0A0E0AMF9_9ORYZ
MAHSLPPSAAKSVALRACLASCSRPQPVCPLRCSHWTRLRRLPSRPWEVPSRSERIAAKLVLDGPSHTVSCAQHNLIRKLGLVSKEGPV